jgi:hypothetical protein
MQLTQEHRHGSNDYALLISQTQGNVTPFVSSYLTANVSSSAERTFTVASTTGVSQRWITLFL